MDRGSESKFMPKKPVIRFSGRKMAVSTVSVRMMSLVRWPIPEESVCTATSARCFKPAHVGQHAFDVLQHVARAQAQQLPFALRDRLRFRLPFVGASIHSGSALR